VRYGLAVSGGLNIPDPTAVIITSDHHAGHTVGLTPPIVNLDDGGTYRPPEIVRRMWAYWLECWQEVRDATQGHRRIWIANGDLVDYDAKQRSNQYITNNKAQTLRLAVDVMEPGLDIVDSVIVVRGTPAHTGPDGELEETIAADITIAEPYSEERYSWPAVACNISGVLFDVRHHTSIGRLPWTQPNAANKLAYNVRNRYIANGHKPPDYVIRSHVHVSVDSGDNYQTRAMTTPAWQLMTTYGLRLDVDYADIGMIAILIDGGKAECKKWIVKLGAQRNPWRRRL